MSNSVRNRLLQSLPQDLQQGILQDAQYLDFERGRVLLDDQLSDAIYFSEGCLFSWVVTLDEGKSVEVSTVGLEGFIGVDIFLGGNTSLGTVMVQIAGPALRISKEKFQSRLDDARLRNQLAAYIQWLLRTGGQSAACLAYHDVEARLAKWLLTVQTAIESDELSLTQEFIANMLGVHRPTVTLTIAALEKAGLIHHRRGKITILDREGLLAASCECFEAVTPLSRATNGRRMPFDSSELIR